MRSFLLPLLVVVEMAALAPLGGVRFDSVEGFSQTFGWYLGDLLVQAAPILVLSVGMTVILMSGGIDLSVGSMTALVACTMALLPPGTSFWLTAVPLGLVVGAGLGLFNGLLVAALDVPPIIATLGTLFFYRGLCEGILRGTKPNPFFDVPGYERLGEWPGALAIVAPLLLLGGAWFSRSQWRREVLMIGGNRVAARFAAIAVHRRLIEVYLLSGVLAFIAAICLTAHDNSATASSYVGMELQVIVAVVLGGTSVNGGRGSLTGSIAGVFLVSILSEGLRAGGANVWIAQHLPFKFNDLSFVLLGALLLGGVWLNTHWGEGGDVAES